MLPAVRIYAASEPTARESLLETRTAVRGNRSTDYELRYRTAGVEPKFRAHKFESEAWGVVFDCPSSGARNGRWFLTEAEARTAFDRWTTGA